MIFSVCPINLHGADGVRISSGLTQLVTDNKSMQKKAESDAIAFGTVNVRKIPNSILAAQAISAQRMGCILTMGLSIVTIGIIFLWA